MEKKDYFEEFAKEQDNIQNEFEDDIVFARFINYMKKALLHKKIDYIRHKEYLTRKEKMITHEEWSVLSSNDNIVYSSFLHIKKENLTNAMKELTEKQQVIIISYYYEGKSLKIIANELESTVPAIKQAKQRAIERLKKYLKKKNEE